MESFRSSSVVQDWVAKFLGLGPAFHHTSAVGGGIIQNTAGRRTKMERGR